MGLKNSIQEEEKVSVGTARALGSLNWHCGFCSNVPGAKDRGLCILPSFHVEKEHGNDIESNQLYGYKLTIRMVSVNHTYANLSKLATRVICNRDRLSR